jgi:hypothetical protein
VKELVDGLFKEIKLIPYTVVVVMAIGAVTTLYVIPTLHHAEAAVLEVHVLKRAVGSMRRDLLRNRIATLDSRLTDLEIEKARVGRLGQVVPDVIVDLLRTATTERALAEEELAALMKAEGDADEP